jgi:hypothetical protein
MEIFNTSQLVLLFGILFIICGLGLFLFATGINPINKKIFILGISILMFISGIIAVNVNINAPTSEQILIKEAKRVYNIELTEKDAANLLVSFKTAQPVKITIDSQNYELVLVKGKIMNKNTEFSRQENQTGW